MNNYILTDVVNYCNDTLHNPTGLKIFHQLATVQITLVIDLFQPGEWRSQPNPSHAHARICNLKLFKASKYGNSRILNVWLSLHNII